MVLAGEYFLRIKFITIVWLGMKNRKEATLIFPHQLFREHPGLLQERKVYLIEEPLFFGDYHYQLNFHKKKLVLHRASLKYYQDLLEEQDYQVVYIDYPPHQDREYLFSHLEKEKIDTLYWVDVVDWALEKRLKNNCKDKDINYIEMDSPAFLTTREEIHNYFASKKHYFLTSFYIWQRKRMNILMDKGKPAGGKWTYDKENRKKIPPGTKIPTIIQLKENKYVKEAKRYVDKKFPHNPGTTQGFNYPTTHREAQKWFQDFVDHKLPFFGDYEDAIITDESFLFHSVISSSINNGLITPDEILKHILRAKNIPLNSLEGFIRQVIGWREFLRGVYIEDGVKERTTNFFQNKNKMNEKLYQGRTGLEPYDKVVQKVIKQAFTHHIERLMVLGNLMLLVDLDPDEIYKWFMEMFIDSYDWVMVPNVYGMSQYADGGLITTKPYFSSSNYLLKMSNFKKGEWSPVWDALFWRFMLKNEKLISRNPRLAVLKRNMKNKKKMQEHEETAWAFLEKLFS